MKNRCRRCEREDESEECDADIRETSQERTSEKRGETAQVTEMGPSRSVGSINVQCELGGLGTSLFGESWLWHLGRGSVAQC